MEAELRPLPKFNYFSPSSLGETFKMLRDYKGKSRLLAGGTDLLVKMKKGAVSPDVVVDLSKISELSFIELAGGNLRIGGLTRLADIGESSLVRERAPALAEAIDVLASSQVRNRATIAGNLCNASPAADTAPPLLVLDASVVLQGPNGNRALPLSEFFIGPGQTRRRSDEVVRELTIHHRDGRSGFLKLGRRKGFTLSIASVAVFAVMTNGKFEDVRIAAGAVAPIPVRSKKAEEMLKGAAVNEENIEKAAQLVEQEVNPITDVRASAAYRRAMACVLTRRVLKKLALGDRQV